MSAPGELKQREGPPFVVLLLAAGPDEPAAEVERHRRLVLLVHLHRQRAQAIGGMLEPAGSERLATTRQCWMLGRERSSDQLRRLASAERPIIDHKVAWRQLPKAAQKSAASLPQEGLGRISPYMDSKVVETNQKRLWR